MHGLTLNMQLKLNNVTADETGGIIPEEHVSAS